MPSSSAVAGTSGGGATVTVTFTVLVWTCVAVTVTLADALSALSFVLAAVPTIAATTVTTTPATVSTSHGHTGQRRSDFAMSAAPHLRSCCLGVAIFVETVTPPRHPMR
jgi:hypothetical protein